MGNLGWKYVWKNGIDDSYNLQGAFGIPGLHRAYIEYMLFVWHTIIKY
jgi:hypothetical protein